MTATNTDEVRRPGTARAGADQTGLISTLSAWGPLPLRLILGFGFLYHGAPKLFTRAGHEQFQGMLAGLDVPLPELAAWGVGLIEVVGGLSLLLGGLTWIFAVLLICDMVVAILLVHLPYGFGGAGVVATTPEGPLYGPAGYEVPLLYIAGLFSLLLTGPGLWSLDGWWLGRRRPSRAERAAVTG